MVAPSVGSVSEVVRLAQVGDGRCLGYATFMATYSYNLCFHAICVEYYYFILFARLVFHLHLVTGIPLEDLLLGHIHQRHPGA